MHFNAIVSFDSPRLLTSGILLLLVTGVIAAWRGIDLGGPARLWFLLGLFCLAAAAGEPRWQRASTGVVTVMVDLSPSTRGAAYRDRALLEQRIRQLLGRTPHRILAFASSSSELPAETLLRELPATRTVFTAPPADAVLLFSDGRFAPPPTVAPTHVVVDPALDAASDAAVLKLELRGDQVIATLRNNGLARSLRWSGATSNDNSPITGSIVRIATFNSGAAAVTASLSPGDLWPENDSLSIHPPPSLSGQKWWIGERDAGTAWRTISVRDLPSDPAAYLDAAVIVLDNVSADSFSSAQQQRLAQYVRDLGGGLVILGGDHAFAAGGYDGTPLDAIAPLASSPPNPTSHWIMLADASGSMAADHPGGGTRWQAETGAITSLLPLLPPEDLVSIGGFAESITWWSAGRSGRKTTALSLPPPSAQPRGPTNLEAALRQVIESAADLPVELLVLSDAETDLIEPHALATSMVAKKCRLHLLALGRGKAFASLQSIATKTGGSVVEQEDPRQWTAAARRLLQAGLPNRLSRDPVDVQFEADLAPLGARQMDLWNRTWLKPRATRLAQAGGSPMAARWQLGAGQVAALAWRAGIADAEHLAGLVAAAPRDRRFTVGWEIGSTLQVTVDAVDGDAHLNGQTLTVELLDAEMNHKSDGIVALPQTAPGRYAVALPAPREPRIASVSSGTRSIARVAVAGRYFEEFDAIGNDRAALSLLAARGGGEVIEPGSIRSLAAPPTWRQVSLAPWLAGAAAGSLAAGLIQWKRRNN